MKGAVRTTENIIQAYKAYAKLGEGDKKTEEFFIVEFRHFEPRSDVEYNKIMEKILPPPLHLNIKA